jgi:hypothetical protein
MLANDRPNPRANIAILCQYLFFFHAYKSIYEHLPEAEFVLDFSSTPGGADYPNEYKEKCQAYLTQAGVYWRDMETSGLETGEFFDKYAVLVGANREGYMRHACNNNKRKVRVMYGAAKESWSFGLHNAYFDLILCAGEYAAKNLELYRTKVVPIGEPKLDMLYNGGESKKEIASRAGITLDEDKQTILFLPTWGSLSSFGIVIPALINIASEFNVIVRPHHVTAVFAPDELNILSGTGLLRLDETTPITDALKLADVVVSDNSSSIFDAIVAGKKLVLIDTIGESSDEFFLEAPFFVLHNEKMGGAPTSANSIEQIIKKEGSQIAPTLRSRYKSVIPISSQALRKAISEAENEIYRNRQQAMLPELFSFMDGFAGKRAAKEINDLVSDSIERDRTIERYVDDLEQRFSAGMKYRNDENEKLLTKLEAIKRLPYLQRIQVIAQEYFS